MTRSEDTGAVLAGRAFTYQLFSSLFGSEPTLETVSIAFGDVGKQALSLFSTDEEAPYATSLLRVFSLVNDFDLSMENDLEALRSEYTRLFIGPEKLAAPPWESVYASADRLLFQRSTLDVRKAYLSQGFRSSGYPRVPDDHIATECSFMAALAFRAQTSFEKGRFEDAVASLEESSSFLSDHLSSWMPDYVAAIEKESRTRLYPALTALAKDFVALDLTLTAELISEIESGR